LNLDRETRYPHSHQATARQYLKIGRGNNYVRSSATDTAS